MSEALKILFMCEKCAVSASVYGLDFASLCEMSRGEPLHFTFDLSFSISERTIQLNLTGIVQKRL